MSKFTDRIDMRFKYVPAASTNIAATIARKKKRQAEIEAKRREQAEADAKEAGQKVRKMR